MDRNTLLTTIVDAAEALRHAIVQENAARLALEAARINRRAAEESVLFGFPDAAAEKAYGRNEAERKAKLRVEHAGTYNAHKDAEKAHQVATAALETARANFEEACVLGRLHAGVAA